jgi:uncharacterized protein (DUF2249 family)
MCEATNNLSIEELDVRSLDLAQRHEKICDRIDELAFGASFVLINDHDPKPLYDQLEDGVPEPVLLGLPGKWSRGMAR